MDRTTRRTTLAFSNALPHGLVRDNRNRRHQAIWAVLLATALLCLQNGPPLALGASGEALFRTDQVANGPAEGSASNSGAGQTPTIRARDLAAHYEELNDAEASVRTEAARWLGEYGNQRSVPFLVDALRDLDPQVRATSEDSLWQIWKRAGTPAADKRLAQGIAFLKASEFLKALIAFSEAIQLDPTFAEAYHKRATTLYYLDDYRGALTDSEQVVRLNPYHFGALSGAGLCMLRLGNYTKAVYYLKWALEVNPNLTSLKDILQQVMESGAGQMS